MRERIHHGALGRLHPPHRLHHPEQQALLALDDFVDELNGFRIGQGQRQNDVGIDDELTQGEDGEPFHQGPPTRTDCAPEELGGCLASRISRKPCS